MSIPLHTATIPVLARGLRVFVSYLDKAIVHAREHGIDEATLVGARLAPDMLPLSGQVQRASDTAKATISRLTGGESPSFPDNETTLAELRARLQATLDYVAAADGAAVDAGAQRDVVLKTGKIERTFRGDDYVFAFGLPNFFFHLVTAHGILRQQGLAIGKLDYLGVTLPE